MKDLSSASTPFTFENLESQEADGPVCRTEFITLFPVEDGEPSEEATAEEDAAQVEQGEAASEEATEEPPQPSLPEPPEDPSRKAFEDAYVQGEKAGYEMGMRRVESIAKRLENQINEVISFKQKLTDRCEKLSTEIALIFAETLVLRVCSDHKDTLGSMIRKALEACEDKSEILIRVRSEDVKYVEGLESSHLKIIPDDTLKEPGFVIETNMGEIDGRIRTQFDELKGALAGHHAG
jgi:flagellar biosynthesis/type III secretory pathway protein FliH